MIPVHFNKRVPLVTLAVLNPSNRVNDSGFFSSEQEDDP